MFHYNKQQGQPRLDTTKMTQPLLQENFRDPLATVLDSGQVGISASDKWETLGKAIFNTAIATFGKTTSNNKDWFSAKLAKMSPVIEAKRTAFNTYRQTPTKKKTCTSSG